MNILRVKEAKHIYTLLEKFDCVFPHLKEKVDDYHAFSEKLEKYASVYVAQEKELICGLLIFYANDNVNKIAYISLIGVLPQWQGNHIGRKLLDYCCRVSLNSGMTMIRLEVDLDNIRAIKFYERYGFERKNAKMTSSIYMEKKLLSVS